MRNLAEKTLLVIEDNAGDFKLLCNCLEESATTFKVLHATSVFEGLSLLEQNAVDLILLDLSLPDSSGFKTLERIHDSSKGAVPVIVLTGLKNELVGMQAIKAGAQDFLVKGQFDARLLVRSIRFALQRFEIQKKLQETAIQLEIHRLRFKEAQELAHFGHWEMDLVSQEMTWSDEVYRIFGYQPGMLTPTLSTYLEFVPLEERSQVEEFVERVAREGERQSLEHRILVGGKAIRHVAVHAKVHQDKLTGKFLIVGGIQDITERKVGEQLLLEKTFNSKAWKYREKILAQLGFNVRTPLASLVNFLHLLDKTTLSPQQREYMEGLKSSIAGLGLAVGNLLNFTLTLTEELKMEEEEMELDAFLSSIENLVQIRADKAGVKFDIQCSDKLPERVVADFGKLTHVLVNLLDLALQRSRPGQTVSLKVSGAKGKGQKMDLAFRLEDRGEFLSREQCEELFDRDKILSRLGQGEEEASELLVGVAIARKLCTHLEGQFSAEPLRPQGLRVELSLPVRWVKPTHLVAGEGPATPLHILLVEDHVLNQIATKNILLNWSPLVKVDIAGNGKIALEKFRTGTYDLILMDLQMPEMDGVTATEHIRRQSDIPIIALTANSSRQEMARCFNAGMNDYLAKPFQPEELYAKILRLMALVAN